MATFALTLEHTLRRALALASERRHDYVTLEHLLLSLIDDDETGQMMRACKVDRNQLRTNLNAYLTNELDNLVDPNHDNDQPPRPTAGFQRVLQRAMLHVDSSGGREVTGANVLVALFSERESHAVDFLQEQDMTRYDAVNFIVHGLPKRAAPVQQSTAFDQAATEKMVATISTRNADLEQQLSIAIAKITELTEALADAKAGRVRHDEPDIFLSYRREQKELVRILVERLRVDGLRVWWDADIPVGAPWEKTITKYITAAKLVLVCWSSEAIESENVIEEAHFGRSRNKLIQVFLDDCEPPMFFGVRQGARFKGWSGDVAAECYRHLMEGIRTQI